jgi:hypothetical protein
LIICGVPWGQISSKTRWWVLPRDQTIQRYGADGESLQATDTGTSSARKREPGLDLAPRASLRVVTMAYGDDPHRMGLMTAGQFGGQTLLSAKALRIYAERGLLPPHFVDPINGYRYSLLSRLRPDG